MFEVVLRQKSVVLKLKSFIEYDNFVIVGDDEVIKLVESDSSFEAMGIKCISASKLECDIKNDERQTKLGMSHALNRRLEIIMA